MNKRQQAKERAFMRRIHRQRSTAASIVSVVNVSRLMIENGCPLQFAFYYERCSVLFEVARGRIQIFPPTDKDIIPRKEFDKTIGKHLYAEIDLNVIDDISTEQITPLWRSEKLERKLCSRLSRPPQ